MFFGERKDLESQRWGEKDLGSMLLVRKNSKPGTGGVLVVPLRNVGEQNIFMAPMET